MRPGPGKRGFTMVELLVVMVLIAVVAAVALPSFGGLFEPARADAPEARLRAAQRAAVESGAPVRVLVDGAPVLFLPDGRAVGGGTDPLTGRPARGATP